MKRVILCATKSQIADKIVTGFKDAGCKVQNIRNQTDEFCELALKLPNGNDTTITVWYDYHIVKNGNRPKTSLKSWKPSYTVNSQGEVYDNGQYVGQALVRVSAGTISRTHKNYIIKSIRTDSGDVIIDHPEIANNYDQVVQTLCNRKVIHRS